jgi:hypothetical protein
MHIMMLLNAGRSCQRHRPKSMKRSRSGRKALLSCQATSGANRAGDRHCYQYVPAGFTVGLLSALPIIYESFSQ